MPELKPLFFIDVFPKYTCRYSILWLYCQAVLGSPGHSHFLVLPGSRIETPREFRLTTSRHLPSLALTPLAICWKCLCFSFAGRCTYWSPLKWQRPSVHPRSCKSIQHRTNSFSGSFHPKGSIDHHVPPSFLGILSHPLSFPIHFQDLLGFVIILIKSWLKQMTFYCGKKEC